MEQIHKSVVINESNIGGVRGWIPLGCVATIGSFDGVHIGHRELLSSLARESHRMGLPSAVLTFLPDDRPKGTSALLALREKKLKLLFENGADFVFELPFGMVRDIGADEFVDEYLLGYFGAKSVVCGYDFRFGSGRSGDAESLASLLAMKNVGCTICPPVIRGGVAVSSTQIRSLIKSGEIETANGLLGSEFGFEGEVIKGVQLAKTLGFPTANQRYPSGLVVPPYGVYSASVGIDGKIYGGILNLGVKPTFGAVDAPLCETHIFGFDGDIYGKNLKISFLRFIRGEKKFASASELVNQIKKDIEVIKE